MIWKYVKMFEETGNVDVVGRVAWSTAVAEDRIAGDSEGLTASYFENAHTHGDCATPTVRERRRKQTTSYKVTINI
jgi:hypothetical protein